MIVPLILIVLLAMTQAQTEGGVWISEAVKNPSCYYEKEVNWIYVRAFLSSGIVDKEAKNTLVSTKDYIQNRRLYINPTIKLTPEEIISNVCSDVIEGLEEVFHVYVVVFHDANYWYKDPAQNREFMEKLRDSMQKHTECFKTINVITRKFDWEQVFGEDYSAFSHRVLIWDKTTGTDCSREGFIPFGGWPRPDGVVFSHRVELCNNTCDVSCLFVGQSLIDG